MSDFSATGWCRKCRTRVAMDDGPECRCPEPETPPWCEGEECYVRMVRVNDGWECPECGEEIADD